MSQKPQNIKISSNAWELLRWAKFKLKSKSYSHAIKEMDKNMPENVSRRLKEVLEQFDEDRHRIKVKVPKDKKTLSPTPRPKTILLDREAHSILEEVKLKSNEPAYTFSDAIEFLIEENDLIPDHLEK